MARTYSAGIVTAYGAAKEAGYTGTYEEFCEQQAHYAQNAAQVASDKATVENLKSTFENVTVPEAEQAVQAEGNAQISAVAAKGVEQVSAVGTAGDAQTGRVQIAADAAVQNIGTAGNTQVNAVNAAGATQVGAVEDAGQEVLDSIPPTYTDFTDNVVKVSDTQPVSEYNRVWVKETTPDGVEVPTYTEFEALSDEVSGLSSSISGIVNYATPLFTNDSTTVAAGTTTTYEANIQKYSNCLFKNESTNGAMLLYVVKDGNTTNLTPNGIAKGNSFSFIAQDDYDHIKVYVNATDLSFSFSSYPVFSSVSAIDSIAYLDKYSGTDTEKLQKCFDDCSLGGTILLTRPITLSDNITIRHNSELNTMISVIGVAKESVINCGNYGFVGLGSKHSNATGGCQFINVTFVGTGVLIDGSTLIRMRLQSCICAGFRHLCRAESTYMQSISIYNSLIRGVYCVITATDRTTENAYDIRLSGNIIEGGEHAVVVGCCFDVVIHNNLIEGLAGTPFIIYSICKMFVVRDNYFESNGSSPAHVSNGCTLMDAYFQVGQDDGWVDGIRNIIVEGNVINQNASDICIKVPPRVFDGAIIIRSNCCNGGILVSSDTSVSLTNVVYEFNTGEYDIPNNSIKIITSQKYNALFE